MNHGNAAQANQIWLHMDAKSRADFSHSEGMQPDTSPDDVKKQVMQHYQDKLGSDDENENSGETIESRPPMSISVAWRAFPSGSALLARRRRV